VNGFAAAKPFKAVYCIDNVVMTCGVADLVSFVSGLGVRVVTCYEVDARLTAWQRKRKDFKPDHRTFRICINRADIKPFLKADAWPTDVVVSRWYFSNRVYTTKDTATTDKPLDMSCAAPAAKPGADSATAATADPAQDGSPTDMDISTPAVCPLTDQLSASGWRMPSNSIT